MIGKIYKPGQGYWTRMVSAVAAGVMVAWGVVWLWNKLSVLDDNAIFIQAGVAVLLLGVFGFLLLRYLGTKPESCDFLIATEGEMKKVNWPTRREVFGSTWIVICSVAMLVLVLFLADVIFADLFALIGVLDGYNPFIVGWCNQRSMELMVVYLAIGGCAVGGVASGFATLRQSPDKQFRTFIGLVAAVTLALTVYSITQAGQGERTVYEMIFLHIGTFVVWLFIVGLSVLLGFLVAGMLLARSAPGPQATMPEQMR